MWLSELSSGVAFRTGQIQVLTLGIAQGQSKLQTQPSDLGQVSPRTSFAFLMFNQKACWSLSEQTALEMSSDLLLQHPCLGALIKQFFSLLMIAVVAV